jgi:Transcriptional regulators
MAKLMEELKQNKPFESLQDEVAINIVRTSEYLVRKHTEFLKNYELTPSQFNVLRILRGAEPDGLICREIGERMVTFDPDVTKLLDRLEARNLVVRERRQKDRRVITVRITEDGLKLLAELDRPLLDYTNDLLGHMSEEKLRKLNELVEEVRENAG